jgi:hypothetical protein
MVEFQDHLNKFAELFSLLLDGEGWGGDDNFTGLLE